MTKCVCRSRENPTYFDVPMHNAAFDGCLVCVQQMLGKNGKNINETDLFGDTALHGASRTGQFDVTRYLLQHKASVFVKNTMGNTPLHYAISYIKSKCLPVEDQPVIRIFLDRGIKLRQECELNYDCSVRTTVYAMISGRKLCQNSAVVFMGIRCKLNSIRDTHRMIGEMLWSSRFDKVWHTDKDNQK